MAHCRAQELWHPVRSSSIRSSQFPPSWENGRAKRHSLEQGQNITSCLCPALKTGIFPPGRTLTLWLGRERALPAIISNICSPLLRCLPSGNCQRFLCMWVFFPAIALPPTACEEATMLYFICLDYIYWRKGHCSFCVKNLNVPCWIIPLSPCPSLFLLHLTESSYAGSQQRLWPCEPIADVNKENKEWKGGRKPAVIT